MMASSANARQAGMALASPADYAECRRVMRAASRNYSFASLVLPRNRRHHVEALYALLREGDDRVDVSHHGFSSPLAAIEDWEATYSRALETGDSPHPVMRAWLNTAVERGIPRETMRPYFRAMKDDLTVTRYATFEDLLHYMEGSAIPVGRAMTYILGVRKPHSPAHAIPHADSLSVAMQLSNFWRDISEDWQRGRVYIPQEDLKRFKVTEAEIAAGQVSPRLIALLEFEIERTERYYDHAYNGIRMLASGQWGVMCSWRVYQAILHDICRREYNVFAHRARANIRQKLWHLTKAWWDTSVVLPRAGWQTR
jgi:phytoene synthase